MPSDLTTWIKKSWTDGKKVWIKENRLKDLFNLSKTLRLYVNQERDKKHGLPPEAKKVAQKWVDYLKSQLKDIPDDGTMSRIVVNVQYAHKYLGASALQGSAFTRKLTATERARFKRLSKPAPRAGRSELLENPSLLDNSHLIGLGNGDS
jgi:hypothetical protein